MPNLQFDVRELQELKQQFDPKDVETALKRAVNAASKQAATRLTKETFNRYDVKSGDIRKRLRIERYRRDVDRAVLYTGRRLPLVQFKPTERWVSVNPKRRVQSGPRKGSMARRRGVSVRIRKDKGRKLVQGGWLAKGHILRRKDKGDTQSQPIMRFGPSIPEMVDNPQVIESAQNLVREVLPKEFSRSLDYILRKKAGLT
jgi:hypothetical protein